MKKPTKNQTVAVTPEPVTPTASGGSPPSGSLPPLSNVAAFHAAHPDKKSVFDANLVLALNRFNALKLAHVERAELIRLIKAGEIKDDEVPLVIHRCLTMRNVVDAFILKAETARQFGRIMAEIGDGFAGGRLTRDFYEQIKEMLRDEAGGIIPFELVEWAIKESRTRPEPIVSFVESLKLRQGLLQATGDGVFQLESERPEQRTVAPRDPLDGLVEVFNTERLRKLWSEFKQAERYCPGGQPRQELMNIYRKQFEPCWKLLDEIRREFVPQE